jgi:hypothetical protein
MQVKRPEEASEEASNPWFERVRFFFLFALPGAVWFLLHQGLSRIPPTHVGWTLQGDTGQEVLGWLMFRNARWGFPLGRIPELAWPMGTSVGFTGATPWVSLLLKPVSPLLPVDFQFIGLWLFFCFALQGVFAGLLMRELSRSRIIQFLGACLFVVAPVLHARMGHDAMCAQFCLLGLFWLHFREAPDLSGAKRLLGWALGFVVFTAGVHPYLNAMVVLLALALVARLLFVDGVLNRPQALGAVGVLLGANALVLFLLGYIGSGVSGAIAGFGEISADLLTFVNPANRSRLFPSLHLERLKDEGFAYLGLGIFLLLAVALVLRLRGTLGGRRLWPLIAVSLLCFVYSLANHVTWAGKEVLDLSALYSPFRAVTDAFRSSGRFTWPLHYLLVTLAAGAVARGFSARPKVAAAVLALGLSLQLVDINYELSLEPLGQEFFHFQDPLWEQARDRYAHLALVPAILHDGTWTGCPTPFPEPFYQPVVYEAYLLKITSNSDYMSRMNMDVAKAQCARTESDVAEGNLSPDTIYVIHPNHAHVPGQAGLLQSLLQSGRARCALVDRLPVCVAAQNQDPFAMGLAQRNR